MNYNMSNSWNFITLILVSIVSIISSACCSHHGDGQSNEAMSQFEADMLFEAAMSSGGGGSSFVAPQCEPKVPGLCEGFGYNSTRMPNFFKDQNQFEALDRARGYQDLIESKCSDKVHHYLCELLIPVCLYTGNNMDEEAMRKFEIYPCRSACRRIQQDCGREIMLLAERLHGDPQATVFAFNCDQLPYESNGKDGPCDPMFNPSSSGSLSRRPPLMAQQSQPTPPSPPPLLHNHRPYQAEEDLRNAPPFVDNSLIDPALIRHSSQLAEDILARQNELARELARPQPRPVNNLVSMANEEQQGTWAQLNSFCQTLVLTLAKYSNAIGLVAIMFLLIALNSNRLKTFKRRMFNQSLGRSPKGSSASSSGSSAASHKPLHLNDAYSGPGGHLSPSASSRSLMLIAGANMKQPPTHKLLPAGAQAESLESSPQLVHAMNKQKTLINLNGTLERQQQMHGRYPMTADLQQFSSRYQQSDVQTLDSRSSSVQSAGANHYDYIQMPSSAEQQQFSQRVRNQQHNQLYSNILLSSPSHQVLLMAEQQQQERLMRQQLGSRTAAPTSQAPAVPAPGRHYLTTSMSPYNSPSSGGSGRILFSDAQYQRSFQRRIRLPSSSRADGLTCNIGGEDKPSPRARAGASHNYTSPPSSASSSASSSGNSNSNSSSALVSAHLGAGGGNARR